MSSQLTSQLTQCMSTMSTQFVNAWTSRMYTWHYYRLVIHSQLTSKLRFPTYIINALITQYNCFINNTSLFIQLTVSVSQSSIKPPCHQRCCTKQYLWSWLWSIILLWSDSWCGIRYGLDLAMVFVFKNNNCAALNTFHFTEWDFLLKTLPWLGSGISYEARWNKLKWEFLVAPNRIFPSVDRLWCVLWRQRQHRKLCSLPVDGSEALV